MIVFADKAFKAVITVKRGQQIRSLTTRTSSLTRKGRDHESLSSSVWKGHGYKAWGCHCIPANTHRNSDASLMSQASELWKTIHCCLAICSVQHHRETQIILSNLFYGANMLFTCWLLPSVLVSGWWIWHACNLTGLLYVFFFSFLIWTMLFLTNPWTFL